ncbi:MAG: methyltransferase domain-containing protein [Gammaproteobacteria bacterium]|nr:methyltransferase domain-containing protein [Gammaproteobacteria bacterium]
MSGREQLHDWFSGIPGRLIVEAEVGLLDQALPNLFGFHLVQVGGLGDADLMSKSRILNRVVVSLAGDRDETRYPVVRGTATALPVESDSVDVVLLPHILEFESQPHEALRESARVLVPEGHVVICGFNPWSMLGCWKYLAGRNRAMPWGGHFLRPTRLRDWLALLGFDVLLQQVCFFKPPFTNEQLLRKLDVLDQAGARLLPYFGGAYILLARKRLTTLTPIRTRWRPKRRLVSVGLVGPAARVADRERSR